MPTQPMKRQYIMLRPMVLGATGFARLEMEGGGLLFQLTGKNLTGHARGLRVFLYAGEGAVQELGGARVNPQGQATMLAEMGPRQGVISPTRLQAVLVTTDDPKPEPLFIGLCVAQSSGSLLDAKNALLALCAKLAKNHSQEALSQEQEKAGAQASQEQSRKAGSEEETGKKNEYVGKTAEGTGKGAQEGRAGAGEPTEERVKEEGPNEGGSAPLARARFALRASSAMPRDFPPQEVFLSAVDPSIYVEADVYATRPPKGRARAEAEGAGGPDAGQSPRRVDPPEPRDGEDVEGQEAVEEAASQPEAVFPKPRTPGAAPVDRLGPVRWPSRWQQLSHYFDEYPAFAPFDMPGWRFVRVPMSKGGSFVLGRMCQDGRAQRILYALPGQRNQPPPKEFARYRWQQGQDGQGYWTLWQQLKGGAGS